ncbi:MAG: PKD domain-containing protein [Chitinophagaceae bacterium]
MASARHSKPGIITKRLRLIILSLLLCTGFGASAGHITGGEMYYTYAGFFNGLHRYNFTLKFYKRCNISTAFPNPAIVSVFNKSTGERFADINAPLNRIENLNLPISNPCISNPPQVCFDLAWYTFTVEVPAATDGYVIASQINFRIAGINNLTPGYTGVGATYTAEIPGDTPIRTAIQNNSARFTGNNLVLVCSNSPFTYSFSATDPDGDELNYYFCAAYNSTAQGGGNTATEPPPYPSVPYNEPVYSAEQPFGPGIQVNNSTGLIQGIAPEEGNYVVSVCVEEIRNGMVIAVQKKDFQLYVADCSIASASLLPEYFLCDESFSISLVNQSSSPVINTTNWEVSTGNGLLYSYQGDTLNYIFPDSGLYEVKLVINRNTGGCRDSTTSQVRVYPGFRPDFSFVGGCLDRPTYFYDQSSSVYGSPIAWNWDFGESSTTRDISSLQNPLYSYPNTGSKTIRLIATDSKGCRDTVVKNINIFIAPPLSMGFRDTLICINDDLRLLASGTGNFSWTPVTGLDNPFSPTPRANPAATTTYFIDLENGGCTNRDSVRVRVVNFVTLRPMADTIICRGDTSQLRILSDGLRFDWSPATQAINPSAQNPFVVTTETTNYTVTASIGGCSATESILVTAIPYPIANAGSDFSVCYNTGARLNGTTNGSSWNWTPARFLSDSRSLSPLVTPLRSTTYVLNAYDTLGCPKAGTDSLVVTVLPRNKISAGNDTSVITGQLLQLNAFGAVSYQWSPALYLSDTEIPDPVALFNSPSSGIRFSVTGIDSNGCRESATVTVKVFNGTEPRVFVPSAFTPNSDGLNDRLRPLSAGIRDITYFRIYSRWGQLLFSTRNNGAGWDGNLGGVPQPAGTYVWVVSATDFRGKAYFQKGVFTLIR